MSSPKNTAVAHFRVSSNLSCASGDGLNNEQNRDHCWKFANGLRLGAARYFIRPTTTPSDAPDLVDEEEAAETSTFATSVVSSSLPILASESALSFEVEHLHPPTEVSSQDKTTHADHSCPKLSNPGRAIKNQDFILADTTDFATQRFAGHDQPIKDRREESHAVGEDSRSNKKREMTTAFRSAQNGHSTFHSPTQSKRRRLMTMRW